MENVASPAVSSPADVISKVKTAIAQMETPTDELIRQAVNEILPQSGEAQALLEFTGYYSLTTQNNGFISIDTTQYFINWPFKGTVIHYQVPMITVNVSLDGVTSTPYVFDASASFDGTTLKIKDLSVTLTRNFLDGILVNIYGTVGSTAVNGQTSFNPVFLPVFEGDYKEVTTRKTILKVGSRSIEFGDGTAIQAIPVFSYNPSMYVVSFSLGQKAYTLMLGTAGGQGLACFITSGQSNDFAVTIPQ